MSNTIICFLMLLLIPTITACSTTHPRTVLTDELTSKFTNQMKAKNDLIIFGSGFRNTPPEKLKALALSFIIEKQVNVQQARVLLVSVCEQLLSQINASQELRPWLSDFPFTGDNLDLMISFNKKHLTEVDPPYIALAYALDGKVYYSINVNDRFKDVHKETYAEALKIYQEQCSNFQSCSDNI